MTPVSVWLGAAVIYALFWSWYVGFGGKTSPELIDAALAAAAKENLDEQRLQNLRQFFENDDGKQFVMVNVLHIKQPVKESMAKMEVYQKAFLGTLLKRAGHPVFLGRASANNIEVLNIDADNWSAGVLVRYRSRADLAHMMKDFAGGEEHALKLIALEKTFAFPVSPVIMLGSVPVLLGLILGLLAALAHILLI